MLKTYLVKVAGLEYITQAMSSSEAINVAQAKHGVHNATARRVNA